MEVTRKRVPLAGARSPPAHGKPTKVGGNLMDFNIEFIFGSLYMPLDKRSLMNPELEKLIDAEVDYLVSKWMHVYDKEYDIDLDKPLYLFTWSPDPGELPDADFTAQHKFNINIVSQYLSSFKVALACVEATQRGVPHYHGWYQLSTDPLLERQRLATVKVLERLGNLKITPSRGHIKKYSLSSKANCLYYYKKDMLESMSWIEQNPIYPGMKDNTDWNLHVGLFTKKGRESIADLENKVNLRDFYLQFYDNSL